MQRRIIKMVMLFAVLGGTLTFGANRYIRAGATGVGNGSDWINAWDDLPSTLTRGDTYYIADGTYSSYSFNDAASGTTVITIKKATASDHGTDTGWNSSYGDGTATFSGGWIFSTPNWLVDGQTRNSDWKTGYGFKINTGQGRGINILSGGANDITIQYIEIEGVGDDEAGSPANDLVYILASISNFTIRYSYLHDPGRTQFLFRDADDGLIEYCYLARNESTAAQHSEGISSYNGTDRWVVRYNIWEDIEGTGIIVFAGDGWEVYGNIFFETSTPGYGGTGNGSVCTWTGYTVTNAKIYNNTFVNLTGWNNGIWFDGSYASGNQAYNNLWYGCTKMNMGGTTHGYSWSDKPTNPLAANAQVNTADPFVNLLAFDFRLAAPTEDGLHLPAPYDVDLRGVSRVSAGQWDRGAYASSIVDLTPEPEKPRNLRIQ